MSVSRVVMLEWVRSLRSRLLVAFLLLGLMPALALGVWGYRFSAQRLMDAGGGRLAQAALTQGDIVDRNLFERYGDAQAFAANPLARGTEAERQSIVDLLTKNYGIYDLVVLVDTSGKVITANSVDGAGQPLDSSGLVGKDVSDTDWFQMVVDGGVEGQPVYGAAHRSDLVSSTYGIGLTTLPFSAPITDEAGDLVGIWHNEASFDRIVVRTLEEMRDSFAQQGFSTVQTQVFDEGGQTLHWGESAEILRAAAIAPVGQEPYGYRPALTETKQALDNDDSYGFTIIDNPVSGSPLITGLARADGALGFEGYNWTIGVYQDAREAAAPAIELRNSLIWVGLIMWLVTVAVALGLARGISNPLRRSVDKLNEVSQGNLAVQFDAGRSDEVGQMSSALNKALTAIRSTLTEVDSGASKLTGSASGLMRTSTEMAEAATQTSNQASEVAGAAEQIASSSHSVALAMDEMSSSIREISTSTSDAARMTSQAVQVSNTAKSRMEKLEVSATGIGAVVNVINSIASQTDLLALNATIEAARVGDIGKGFAVVANEVKALARQTAEATDEIQAKIDAIQADAKEAVGAIAEIADLITRVDEASTVIAGAVDVQSAASADVSASIMAMTDGTSNISRNIVAVADAASATRSGAGNAERAASELTLLAGRLQSLLAGFKLSSSARESSSALVDGLLLGATHHKGTDTASFVPIGSGSSLFDASSHHRPDNSALASGKATTAGSGEELTPSRRASDLTPIPTLKSALGFNHDDLDDSFKPWGESAFEDTGWESHDDHMADNW